MSGQRIVAFEMSILMFSAEAGTELMLPSAPQLQGPSEEQASFATTSISAQKIFARVSPLAIALGAVRRARILCDDLDICPEKFRESFPLGNRIRRRQKKGRTMGIGNRTTEVRNRRRAFSIRSQSRFFDSRTAPTSST